MRRFAVKFAAALGAGAFLATSLATAAPRPEPKPAIGGFIARPSSAGRFVYLRNSGGMTPDGGPAQQVRLARITSGLTPPLIPTRAHPTAADVSTLMDTGALPTPRHVMWIGVSPGNSRVLVYSDEIPINALDHDLQVWNMATGAALPQFNEHSAASYIHRGTCPSPAFDAYLAAAYAGAPPGTTAGIDFGLSVEGMDGANVPAPQIIGWIDNQQFAVRWKFTLHTTDGQSLEDTFDIIINWPAAGGGPTMTCAVAPAIPAPKTALTATPLIRLRGSTVYFGKFTRSATKIAGIIWP